MSPRAPPASEAGGTAEPEAAGDVRAEGGEATQAEGTPEPDAAAAAAHTHSIAVADAIIDYMLNAPKEHVSTGLPRLTSRLPKRPGPEEPPLREEALSLEDAPPRDAGRPDVVNASATGAAIRAARPKPR